MTREDAMLWGVSGMLSILVVWWMSRAGMGLGAGEGGGAGGAGGAGGGGQSAGGRRKRSSKGSSGGFGRDVSGVPASIWFVAAAMVYLSMNLAGGLSLDLSAGIRGAAGSLQNTTVLSACAFGGGAIGAVVMLYLLWPRAGEGAGFRIEPLGDAWRGVVAFALTVPAYVFVSNSSKLLSEHVLHIPVPKIAHAFLESFVREVHTPWAWGFVLVTVVLTPIAEECLYRVFAQSCVMSLVNAAGLGGNSTWVSIAITSAIFAAMHAIGGGPVPWAAVPGLFVLALGFGAAYEKTGRLGVPIVMHASFNASNFALALLGRDAQ